MTFANEDKFFNKKQKDFKRFELSTSNSVTHKLHLTLEKLIWIQLKISLISQVHKGPRDLTFQDTTNYVKINYQFQHLLQIAYKR